MGNLRSIAKRPQSTATAEAPEYVLGTGAAESARLGLQHRLWSSCAHDLWERAGIKPGMTVLDVGCGPGHATMDLAQIVGEEGRVIAIDESPAFLKQLNDESKARKFVHIDRVLGDVQDLDAAIPGVDDLVDLAYARWVFCFLARPEDVVRGLARLIKPGGKLVIQDYFNYETMTLAPRREIFSKVIRAVAASWRNSGGDPDVMARLPAMLRKHGFEVTHLGVQQRVARPGETMWYWPDSFWQLFVPRLAQLGFITDAERQSFFQAWKEASADQDTFMQLPPVFDLIAVRR